MTEFVNIIQGGRRAIAQLYNNNVDRPQQYDIIYADRLIDLYYGNSSRDMRLSGGTAAKYINENPLPASTLYRL